MADDLIFYTHPMSRGRTVRWALEEVGAAYRAEILDYRNTMKEPDFLSINPMGKVPAIVHRGAAVTETAAICAYLADAFPEAGLAPPPAERGPYYRWMFFAAGPIEAAVANAAIGVVVPDGKEGMMGYGRGLPTVLETVESALGGGDYVASTRFTMADLYLSAHLGFGMMFGLIEKRPAFEAYVARCQERPAAVRAREIDDGLLAEMKQAG